MKNAVRIALAVLALACLSTLAIAEPTQSRAVLTLEGAKRVAAAAIEEARRLGAPSGALAVVDEGARCSTWSAWTTRSLPPPASRSRRLAPPRSSAAPRACSRTPSRAAGWRCWACRS